MTILRAAGILSFALLAACDVKVGEGGVSLDVVHGRASDEWTRTYTIEPGGQLEIVNANGRIEAVSSNGRAVQIVARREVRAQTDEAAASALRSLRMVEETDPGRVRIAADTPGAPDGSVFGAHRSIAISYRVSVPSGLVAALRNENGEIRVSGIEGRLMLASTNGGLVIERISGPVEARTVNGSIVLDLARIGGDVKVETVNGGIRVSLPADAKASLDARTVNGSVLVHEALGLQAAERGRTHVAGTLNGGGPAISIRTTNGGVRVMPHGASAE